MKSVLKKEGVNRFERIRKKREFEEIFGSAKKINLDGLRIYYTKNKMDVSRFTVVASRKVGNAVVRNRLKRVIREVYRRHKNIFGEGIDWIFVPKGKWERINYSYIERKLLDVIKGIKKRNADNKT